MTDSLSGKRYETYGLGEGSKDQFLKDAVYLFDVLKKRSHIN